MKDQFIIFLTQNRLLNKFKTNMENPLCSFYAGGLGDISDYEDVELFFLCAFDWELTPEGDPFWANVFDEWQARVVMLNKLNSNN